MAAAGPLAYNGATPDLPSPAMPARTSRNSRKKKSAAGANPLWGGRFAAGPAAVMAAINASIDVDKRLWREDVAGSLAHVAMLAKQRIIPRADAAAIARGLRRVAAEIESGRFRFS